MHEKSFLVKRRKRRTDDNIQEVLHLIGNIHSLMRKFHFLLTDTAAIFWNNPFSISAKGGVVVEMLHDTGMVKQIKTMSK